MSDERTPSRSSSSHTEFAPVSDESDDDDLEVGVQEETSGQDVVASSDDQSSNQEQETRNDSEESVADESTSSKGTTSKHPSNKDSEIPSTLTRSRQAQTSGTPSAVDKNLGGGQRYRRTLPPSKISKFSIFRHPKTTSDHEIVKAQVKKRFDDANNKKAPNKRDVDKRIDRRIIPGAAERISRLRSNDQSKISVEDLQKAIDIANEKAREDAKEKREIYKFNQNRYLNPQKYHEEKKAEIEAKKEEKEKKKLIEGRKKKPKEKKSKVEDEKSKSVRQIAEELAEAKKKRWQSTDDITSKGNQGLRTQDKTKFQSTKNLTSAKQNKELSRFKSTPNIAKDSQLVPSTSSTSVGKEYSERNRAYTRSQKTTNIPSKNPASLSKSTKRRGQTTSTNEDESSTSKSKRRKSNVSEEQQERSMSTASGHDDDHSSVGSTRNSANHSHRQPPSTVDDNDDLFRDPLDIESIVDYGGMDDMDQTIRSDSANSDSLYIVEDLPSGSEKSYTSSKKRPVKCVKSIR